MDMPIFAIIVLIIFYVLFGFVFFCLFLAALPYLSKVTGLKIKTLFPIIVVCSSLTLVGTVLGGIWFLILAVIEDIKNYKKAGLL